MNDTVPPSFQWILLMAGANFPQSVPTPGLNDQRPLDSFFRLFGGTWDLGCTCEGDKGSTETEGQSQLL